MLIGLNAGVNLVLLVGLSAELGLASLPAAPAGGGLWALLTLCLFFFPWAAWLLNNLAGSLLSRSPVYQGFLGWFAWLLPMAWPNTALGFVIVVTNLLARALALPTVTGALPGGGGTFTLNATLLPFRFDFAPAPSSPTAGTSPGTLARTTTGTSSR